MAAEANPPAAATAPSQSLLLPRVSWETYAQLVDGDEERRVPRLTYDRGVLEIVSPSPRHEQDAQTLILLIELVAGVRGVPVRQLGSTTFRRADLQRGFEADGSFYIQHEARMRHARMLDLATDPPPDLVIEMEVRRSSLDKLDLFASLGIPEIWRGWGERVVILDFDGSHYVEAPTSRALGLLTPEIVSHFLSQSRVLPSPDWFQAVIDWARAEPFPVTPEAERSPNAD